MAIKTTYKGKDVSLEPILKGRVACVGENYEKLYKAGMAVVIDANSDYDPGIFDTIEKGYFLVTQMTNPRMATEMLRSGAIITDEGGVTCHAANVAREYKITCITA